MGGGYGAMDFGNIGGFGPGGEYESEGKEPENTIIPITVAMIPKGKFRKSKSQFPKSYGKLMGGINFGGQMMPVFGGASFGSGSPFGSMKAFASSPLGSLTSFGGKGGLGGIGSSFGGLGSMSSSLGGIKNKLSMLLGGKLGGFGMGGASGLLGSMMGWD